MKSGRCTDSALRSAVYFSRSGLALGELKLSKSPGGYVLNYIKRTNSKFL